MVNELERVEPIELMFRQDHRLRKSPPRFYKMLWAQGVSLRCGSLSLPTSPV